MQLFENNSIIQSCYFALFFTDCHFKRNAKKRGLNLTYIPKTHGSNNIVYATLRK